MGSTKLFTLFGMTKTLQEYVQEFDCKKEHYFYVGLALSFGSLNKESVKKRDEELKITIAGLIRSLRKQRQDREEPLDWETVVSTCIQHPLLVPFQEGIVRREELSKKLTNYFKFDGSPDRAVVEEFNTWFVNVIADEDVLNSTMIDINVMANIVALTGAAIRSLPAIFVAHKQHEKKIVDIIGVLRFPDIENPYFKVYRIKLKAWSKCERYAAVQLSKDGIACEYNMRKFVPRLEIIAQLSQETQNTAMRDAESLFAD